MADIFVAPARLVQGELVLPGDKSISHRALLIGLISEGSAAIHNLAPSADVASTRAAVEILGASIADLDTGASDVRLEGVGMRGLRMDGVEIDAGNAGTLVRLVAGILAGQPSGSATIVGDASLSARPMARVVDPLRAMGARIDCDDANTLPLTVHGSGPLHAIDHTLAVASAQVQSALLLAGLYADGPTTMREPATLRDHTERMLRRAGVSIERDANIVRVEPARSLSLPDTRIPADTSSAAPFVLASALLHGSLLRVPNLGANPGRMGFVALLERMGARIGQMGRGTLDGEPVVDLEVQHHPLQRVNVHDADVSVAIDEMPLFALACQFCKGATVVHGAGELRVKESDRISTMVSALRRIGVNAEELPDGFVVRGSGARPGGGGIDAAGDHRIAMLGGVAGLVSRDGVTVSGAECVDVSFPGFFDAVEAIAQR